jgi:hypothetical protein
MRTLAALLLSFMLFVTPGTLGCAVVPYLPTVIAAVTDANMILDGIEKFVERFFAAKPDSVLQAKVEIAVARTRGALNLALRSAQGVEKLDQAQIDAAFVDFKIAYQELLALTAPLGVSSGPALRAVPGGLNVPEPMALTLKVK